MIPSHTAGRLNVFGRRFWLPLNDHQPEPGDVQANGDHVCGERDIDCVSGTRAELRLEGLLRFRHLVRGYARGQFQQFLNLSIGKWTVLGIEPPALGSVTPGAVSHFILDNPARAAELTQRIEIAKRRHIRIAGVRVLSTGRRVRVVCRLRGSNQGRQRPQEDELRPPPLRGDTQIKPGGIL